MPFQTKKIEETLFTLQTIKIVLSSEQSNKRRELLYRQGLPLL